MAGNLYGSGLWPSAFAEPVTAIAQEAAFFKGKTVNMVIGFGPGASNDFYGRLVARHLGRHIPGEPTLVPQNMPGAGSFKAANFLYGVAPKDGTSIIVTQTLATEEALARPATSSSRRTSPGSAGDIGQCRDLHVADTPRSKPSPTQWFRRLRWAPPASSSTVTTIYPIVLNAIADTQAQGVVLGYESSTAAMRLMERGRSGRRFDRLGHHEKITKQDWLRDQKVNIIVQYGPERQRTCPTCHPPSNWARPRRTSKCSVSTPTMPASANPSLAPPALPTGRKAAACGLPMPWSGRRILADVKQANAELIRCPARSYRRSSKKAARRRRPCVNARAPCIRHRPASRGGRRAARPTISQPKLRLRADLCWFGQGSPAKP